MIASVGDDLFRAVLQGAPPGTVYALIAVGFVLAYKTSGVFNLAFGAQAYVSAVIFFQLNTLWGWPTLWSFLFAVPIGAPLLGVALERLVFRHLRTKPPVAGLVVAIGLTVALPALIDIVLDFQPKGGQTPQGILPRGNNVFYKAWSFYSFSRNELVAMVAVVITTLGLVALFHFTVAGLRMRAVVESPRMTELNGIAANRVSASAWALSSFFAGLAGVLIAPRFPSLAAGQFFNLVVIAIAAAAIGGLVSLPRTFAGGIGLGLVIALFNTFIPKWSNSQTWLRPIQSNLTPAVPFIVLFAVVVFVPSIRRSQRSSDPLGGVDPPPTSHALATPDPKGDLIRRLVGTVAFIAVAVVLLERGDTVWIFLATQGVVLSIVFMSITVVTGMGGHISLAQSAFAATGALVAFQLADRYNVPVLAGALIGAAGAALLGAIVSLPLRRLNGIWIAIATLAFAYFFDSVLVKFSWFGGTRDGSATQKVPRPVLGPWDLKSDKTFLIVVFVILLIVATGVTLFGRSTTGRKLRALRGSEVAAQAIGISSARARTITFAVSAGVAGLGGALLAIQQKSVSYDTNFSPFGGLFWLVLVVTFGARGPAGAVAAASAYSLMDRLLLQGTIFGWILRDPQRVPGIFPISTKWRFILFGLGTIQYARHPEGIIEMSRAQGQRRRNKRAERRRLKAADGTIAAAVTNEEAVS